MNDRKATDGRGQENRNTYRSTAIMKKADAEGYRVKCHHDKYKKYINKIAEEFRCGVKIGNYKRLESGRRC
jgi:hypothetical protein